MKEFLLEYEAFLAPLLLVVISASFVKEPLHRIFSGIKFWMSKDFNAGDICYIDGDLSRIISIGFVKTIFENEERGTWRYVYNDRIPYLKLERKLPDGGNASKDIND